MCVLMSYLFTTGKVPDAVKEELAGKTKWSRERPPGTSPPASKSSKASIDGSQTSLRDAFKLNRTDAVNKKLAKAIFHAGSVAWRFVDNPYFRDWAHDLANGEPGYKPPTRKTLVGKWLRKLDDELDADIYEIQKKDIKSLIMDGFDDTGAH